MFEAISIEDISQLFSNTVIKYDGKPVYVHNIDYEGQFHLSDLLEQKDIAVCKISDPKLDFMPVKLGMVNEGNSCFWVRRYPVRAYKQGLHHSNVLVHTFDRKGNDFEKVCRLVCKGVENCINGEYPEFKTVLDTLSKESSPNMIGISREFAINRDFELFWKKDKVAVIDSDSGNSVFLRGMKHVKSLFEERHHA